MATGNLPSWADSPQTYFEAAEQYESYGGDGPKNKQGKYARVAFEEWKITLPVELTLEQNKVLAAELMQGIAGERLPYTYAFHNPKTLAGTGDQPHLHVLISARQTDGIERTAIQHFKRYNCPAHGGARKDAQMNVYHATKLHRLMISDIVNVHLECNNIPVRVHPESLKSRGIDREAEPKLRPSDSDKYRKKHDLSKTMLEVFRIRSARIATLSAEQDNAAAQWGERKKFLGLDREMSREEKVARIVALRHGTASPPLQRSQPRQQVAHISAADLDKRWAQPVIGNRLSKIYHTPRHKNYGDVNPQNQVRFWTEREAQAAGYRRARNDHYGRGSGVIRTDQARQRQRGQAVQHTQSVPRRLQRLAWQLGQDDEAVGGGRLRVRLHDDEREQGMGW